MSTLPTENSGTLAERRGAGRFATRMPSGLRRSGSKQKQVVLANISTSGCTVKEVINLRAGERVWITLPGLASQMAEIRWTQLGSAGLHFDEPLYAAVVERICSLDRANRQNGLQTYATLGSY